MYVVLVCGMLDVRGGGGNYDGSSVHSPAPTPARPQFSSSLMDLRIIYKHTQTHKFNIIQTKRNATEDNLQQEDMSQCRCREDIALPLYGWLLQISGKVTFCTTLTLCINQVNMNIIVSQLLCNLVEKIIKVK